jgi:putative aldouronate transport system substrate-binding protein
MKKILVIALALVMVLSIVACSGGNNASKPDSKPAESKTESTKPEDLYYNPTGEMIFKEPTTLTVTGMRGSTDDWSKTDSIWWFEEHFGIKLECHEYTKDEWSAKWIQMLSSDDLYDLVIYAQCTYADMVKYGNDGYFLDFAKYADLMPNYKDFCEVHTGYDEFLRQEGGELWGFNIYNAQGYSSRSITSYINMNHLENLNLEVPKTREQLHDVLVAIKDGDANGNGETDDEIPMTIGGTSPASNEYMILWGFGIETRQMIYALQADDAGKLYLADLTDDYRAYLSTMNAWYEEKLIDEYFQTREDGTTQMQKNNIGWGAGVYAIGNWTEAKEKYGNTLEYFPLSSAFTEKETDERFTMLKHPVNFNGNINMLASANCEYPEAVARFYDYMFDLKGEGCNSSLLGWEGVNYKLVEYEDTGYFTYDCTGFHNKDSEWEYRRNAWLYQAMCTAYLRDPSNWGLYDKLTTEELLDMGSYVNTFNGPSNNYREVGVREEGIVCKDAIPALGYNAKEAEVRTKYYSGLESALKTAYYEFITGVKDIDDDNVWNAHVKAMEKMGVDKLLEADQAAYDRWIAAIK